MRNRGINRLRRLAMAVVLLSATLVVPCAQGQQYFRFGKNKVQYEAHEWSYVQSDHFDIYYYEGGYYLADFSARAAEAAYQQIVQLFDYEISDRIPIIVYQSHNDFVVTNAVNLPTYSEGIGGVTELYKNRIAVPFTGDYRDYRRVLHHELVHAVLNDMFYGGSLQSIVQNDIQLLLPGWFNEGLAEYAALGWDTQSDMYVREAVLEDDLATIPQLDGYFAYRGGQSVWDYIAEQYGREKIAEILQRIRMSRSVEGAFLRATGLTIEQLSHEWQRTLKEIYYPELPARENLDTYARAIVTRKEGYYNTSAAISPRGDQVAFISTRGALFDVYLADANDGKVIRKLIDAQDNTMFESLRLLTPGITWSPDGNRIAIAVKSGPTDAIALVDVKSGRARLYRVPDIDQILTVAWSPDGRHIAFEGSRDSQSDIFVLDLNTRETVNYTDDVFSDHEPSWSADGKQIVFHSDRGNMLELRRYQDAGYRIDDHDYGQFDIYVMDVGDSFVRPLVTNPVWDDEHAKFSRTPGKLLFVSDRNGVRNLYEKDLATGAERPLSDLLVGVMQVSLSADGERAALVALREGVPSIYVLNHPFKRRLNKDVLVPNVWAQRVMQDRNEQAPAIQLASVEKRKENPLMRDATDGRAYPRDRRAEPSRTYAGADLASRLLSRPPGQSARAQQDSLRSAPFDSTRYGGVKIDFRDYLRPRTNDPELDEELAEFEERFSPRDNLDENGHYKPRKYKLQFSPDLVYGAAGFETLYGVQGITQMMFSDMLGNHQIFLATNLLIDLRNSDYLIAYQYLPRRIDWNISGFHISRLLPDYRRLTYYRFRQYGGSLTASYPIDKFRRIDADLSLLGVSQADIGNPAIPQTTRSVIYPSIKYTNDVSSPGYMYPVGGYRYALSLSGSPGNVTGKQVRFLTALGDARAYTSFGRTMYVLAFRASGGASVGPDPQMFFTSGVQNWINRRFALNGFPIDDVSDFLFATPVLPLRGTDINARNGSYFGLLNAEFRFPLVAALLPGPLPIIPLYNVQGSAFVDAGSVWGGRGQGNGLTLFGKDGNGRFIFDDLLVGAGFGLRTILIGYPVRLDFAWPYDGQRFGPHRTYVSIGLDF